MDNKDKVFYCLIAVVALSTLFILGVINLDTQSFVAWTKANQGAILSGQLVGILALVIGRALNPGTKHE